MRSILLIPVFCGIAFLAQAQQPSPAGSKSADSHAAAATYACYGTVKHPDGLPVAGASVQIAELNRQTVSDDEGRFSFSGIPAGHYLLRISHLGDKAAEILLDFSAKKSVRINVTLEPQIGRLRELTVAGKSENREVADQPVKAEVINTRAVQEQPSTLVEVMNRTAGIRIRQSGGLGAPANLSINGFQGRSVKYFRDGIPMDYLGAAYDISLLPVNMLERVEVYKGVLPARLGADALGGAVNMVSKHARDKSLEASYETGSFNTHRAALNAFFRDTTTKLFAGINAFYNYSDNNYDVDVLLTDPETGKQEDDPTRVKLFHNRFRNYFGEIYAGVSGTKWADELRLGLTGFHIDRQAQFAPAMTQPFGAAFNSQYALVPTLRYKKAFFNDKLRLDQFFAVNTLHIKQVDTAAGQYDWYGRFTPSTSRRGELSVRGSLAQLNYSYYTSRSRLSYRLGDRNTLDFNMVFSGFKRVGHDPLGITFTNTGKDVLSLPARYDKRVLALGLETRFPGEKLTNDFIVKHFHYTTRATGSDYAGGAIDYDNKNSQWGAAEALKFELNRFSFLRLSGETTLRLPEQDELFGDGNMHLPNLGLKPERSMNLNLGYRLDRPGQFALELNGFYRRTKNMILQVPYNFLYTQSQNIQQVKGLGIEADVRVKLLDWLEANGNVTYQDMRLFNTGNPGTEDARLRNTPYFFANAGLEASLGKVLLKNDRLKIYWHFLFVREYYLDVVPKDKEPDGFLGLWGKAQFDAPNIIPNQSVHTAGFVYSPSGKGFSLGFQVKDIFDVPVYDNFKIQNAGRSFYVKLNYSIP
ncbi:TonB-dependent receptor [Compostibacter hankyongensis]|uniref:TonB-dependent receptor n=1 Tax=Compostibacter hankyongensis TaxID=1007089 RepID=A0ABP8FS92_9BACT